MYKILEKLWTKMVIQHRCNSTTMIIIMWIRSDRETVKMAASTTLRLCVCVCYYYLSKKNTRNRIMFKSVKQKPKSYLLKVCHSAMMRRACSLGQHQLCDNICIMKSGKFLIPLSLSLSLLICFIYLFFPLFCLIIVFNHSLEHSICNLCK